MACFHPIKGFYLGDTLDGKKRFKIVPYDVDHIELHSGVCDTVSVPHVFTDSATVLRDYVVLPCGHCAGCQLSYSKQWAARCLAELQYCDSAYFLTLTYSDEHIPLSGDNVTGEVHQTLCKRDWQLFMKRLRKEFDDQKLRMFACGEYGDCTMRPHIHAIVFGLKIPDKDLKLYKYDPRGYNLYNCDRVNKCWTVTKNGKSTGELKGHVVIGDVTYKTCAYVARYCTKKMYGKKAQFYKDMNIEPPFLIMSRNPGIGAQYYEDNKKKFLDSQELYFSGTGGTKFTLPKYFVNRLLLDFPDEGAKIKENRRLAAEASLELELSQTDLDAIEYFRVKEDNFNQKIKSLKRSAV